MEHQTRYSMIMGLGVGVLLTVAVVWIFQTTAPEVGKKHAIETGARSVVERAGGALVTVQGGTRRSITELMVTPEPGDVATEGGVAVPNSSIRIGEQKQATLRVFSMTASGGEFSPSTIVVDDGDVVEIEFSAVDGSYDIFFPDLGILETAEQGKVKTIQFQATPFGRYSFGCFELCEGEGTLIVNQKEV